MIKLIIKINSLLELFYPDLALIGCVKGYIITKHRDNKSLFTIWLPYPLLLDGIAFIIV